MTLKAGKDFMVFKQRDLLWSGLLLLTFCTLEAVFTTTEENKVAFTVLWFRNFLARPILPINRSYFMEKRGTQIFSKIVRIRASKLTRQRALEINNAHLDRSRCWQRLQEATKKTFSFKVSWQKQIKFYFSSQNWVVI